MAALSRFRVFLRRGDDPQAPVEHFEIDAETRRLAARAAAHAHPGWKPYKVMVIWNCAGTCERCRAILFDDDLPSESKTGLRCRDC